MSFQLHPIGIFSTAILVVLLWLATVVFRAAPHRFQNRVMAGFIVTSAIPVWLSRGLRFLWDDPVVALAAVATAIFFSAGFGNIFYFLLIGTIRSDLQRILAHPALRVAFVLVAGSLAIWIAIIYPRNFWVERFPHLPAWSIGQERALLPWDIHTWISITLAALATITALLAIKRASSALAKRQAVLYAVAFMFWDITTIVGFLVLGNAREWVDQTAAGNWYIMIMQNVQLAIFALLLGYALLRGQLFNVELRLKWTISRGTVATIFLGVFAVVSLAASEWLVDKFGYLFGAGAAGMMLLVLRPLQRAGERVADAAMPHVQDTPEYRERRRA